MPTHLPTERSLLRGAVLAFVCIAAVCPAAVAEPRHDDAPPAEPAASAPKPKAARITGADPHSAAEARSSHKAPMAAEKAASGADASAPDSLVSIGERIAERIRIRAMAPSNSLVRVGAHGGAGGEGPAGKHAHAEGPAHWSYEGDAGPQAWAQLQPEFAQCAKGTRQSPIDIDGGIKVQLDPVAFDYRPGPFRVVDNGHTVQVLVSPGSFIEVMGRRFELVQFHFHRPSEERVNGRQFDMVVHLVHKDSEGRLAVIAVLLERGSAQPVVQSIWNNLPLEKGDEVRVRTSLDPTGLLPADRRYYTYMGSLTTPPCSEGVLWMVMKTPVPISPPQLGIFARLYPMNARPIQSASGRLIKESE